MQLGFHRGTWDVINTGMISTLPWNSIEIKRTEGVATIIFRSESINLMFTLRDFIRREKIVRAQIKTYISEFGQFP